MRQQVAAAGHDALMVFAAEKISRTRELRLAPTPVARNHARDSSLPRPRRVAH
jgi:hypothetical protein